MRFTTGSAWSRFTPIAGSFTAETGRVEPVWRRDGAELFFAAREGRVHSVSVRLDATGGLAFGAVTPLNVPPLGERHWGTTYEISADGRRVYFPHPPGASPPREFGVILNWMSLLKQLGT